VSRFWFLKHGTLAVFTSHSQGYHTFTEIFSSSQHKLSASRSLFDIIPIADLVCKRT